MSYSEFDSFDNSIEKMLETEKRRFFSPFNYEGKSFSYFEMADANLDKEGEPSVKYVPAKGFIPPDDEWTGQEEDDRVNSPSHYTRGKQEAIDIIEEAIQDAPTPGEGLLQGQVLKYMLRVWLKDNPLEDLKKARWYLTRLISKLEDE